MNFDPNKLNQKQYLWATYLPYRNPSFKLHVKEAHAKSAFTYRNRGILFLWNSGTERWDEVFRAEEDHEYETCIHGGSPRTNSRTNKIYHENIKWVGKGKDSKRVAVCYTCRDRGVLM